MTRLPMIYRPACRPAGLPACRPAGLPACLLRASSCVLQRSMGEGGP